MRMTSPEKLILENQSLLLMAVSVLVKSVGEDITARSLMLGASKTLQVLKDAKEFPE